MRIDISVEISDARQWLLLLKSKLEADGHQVFFQIIGEEHGLDASMSLLKVFEIGFFGEGRGLWRRGNLNVIRPLAPDTHADLVISLSGGTNDKPDLRLFLDGKAGIGHASEALLAKHIPYLDVRTADGTILAAGLPAIEMPEIIIHAMDGYYARVVTVIHQAVMRHQTGRTQNAVATGVGGVPTEPVLFALKTLSQRVLKRLAGNRSRGDHWRVGIRHRRPRPPIDGDMLMEGFTWLPDDGERFYADPILFEEDGRHFLFMEEYPYATRRGVISWTELGADGQALHPPRVAIESIGHMSYPFLFRQNGAIYMIPENASENRLPLYRATHFPDQWVFERNLLDLTDIHDATPTAHEGAIWLLGTTRAEGASSWDCLCVYRADTMLGPFVPVQHNPVLIDARYARPAGPSFLVDGVLIRPVQSCLGRYGRFLRFLAVEQLDDGGIIQRECGRLLPPRESGIQGLHTFCMDSRFEVIDAC